MAAAYEGSDRELAEAVFLQALPVITNVVPRAPKVAADFGAPFPNISLPVLAQAVDNRATAGGQRVAHFLVNRLHLGVLVKLVGGWSSRT